MKHFEMKFIQVIIAFGMALYSLNVYAIKIENVFYDHGSDHQVAVRFHLSERADVHLNIYDDRDYLIRQLSLGTKIEGDHVALWDLKDRADVSVPSEAYKFTVVAVNANGKRVVHDLSDITGTESVKLHDLHINKSTGDIEFILDRPSRVLIRAGLKGGGPLLVTLSNWVAFEAGQHKIPWNGLDASGIIDLKMHKKLYLDARAYSLSDNTIIVGPQGNATNLIDVSSWNIIKREVVLTKKKKMIAAYQQSITSRGDYVVSLKTMQGYPVEQGAAVVNGVVDIKLNIDKKNMATAINQRVEPVFYIDGKFAYENEVGFYPMTWKLDTRNLNEGEHYLTVNLRGYEGNFGIASTRVIVRH